MEPILPGDGEDPFFCLLEDDKQVSHISVETDTLLYPRTGDGADLSAAHLARDIGVATSPFIPLVGTLEFK
jgi:hypothetical protein